MSIALSICVCAQGAALQTAPSSQAISIEGAVTGAAHKAVAGAAVTLEGNAGPITIETDGAGNFTFSALREGEYKLSAQKAGERSPVVLVNATSGGEHPPIELVLEPATSGKAGSNPAAADAMQFADKPDFTIAGVTDWTAVGGHGSDSILRTSEGLARETLTLKPDSAPPAANHVAAGAHHPAAQADAVRAKAEADEKSGDALDAVREFEEAAKLDPSEQNYFAWGSDLLLHRAVWQAEEVFANGAKAYPESARMEAALGSALFAGARYDEAALHLCKASDLRPEDTEPYLFMGKIAMVSPAPSACIEQRLARFARQHAENATANYLYAMAIWKQQPQPADSQAMQQVQGLLRKAVQLDSKCADGYLQLGILALSQRDLNTAIGYFSKAVEANPLLGEAHYRLGVAYDRAGKAAEAAREFKLHDEIEKADAARAEEQRRAVKQFLIVLEKQPAIQPER